MGASRMVQRGFKVQPEWIPALNNISIVLVGITHPGNIGAVARVMKNMALSNLTLVSSTDCGPGTDAFPMASGAYDVVERARKTAELKPALSETVMAIGTSSRLGGKRVSAKTPAELIPRLMESAMAGPVACVFGRESRGLTNDEFKLCSHHMIIPTDAQFASMNIAQAVAVTGYEIFKAAGMPTGFQARKFKPASSQTREEMYRAHRTSFAQERFSGHFESSANDA